MALGLITRTTFSFVAGVFVDTRQSEEHTIRATPATYALETGAIRANHTVLQPEKVSIRFTYSNIDFVGTSIYVRSATLYTLLVNRLKSRSELFTIITHHRLYTDMQLVGLPAKLDAEQNGLLVGQADFVQVKTTQTVTGQDPSQYLNDGTRVTATPAVNRGTQILSLVPFGSEISSSINTFFGVA